MKVGDKVIFYGEFFGGYVGHEATITDLWPGWWRNPQCVGITFADGFKLRTVPEHVVPAKCHSENHS